MDKVELLREGYLVKGVSNEDEARLALGAYHSSAVKRWKFGRYRKVPGQWSNFNLYEGEGAGSFQAGIGYIDG